MGAGMNKILPGLYLGSIRDSKDLEQIKQNNITHILSIHEEPKPGAIENVKYLCFNARDHASQDLKKFFSEAIFFIHSARLEKGNVLVHCLAGVSRSTTLVVSYIMTISEMPWYDSLNAVRGARKEANPNFGFQRQLQNFEFTTLKTLREELYNKFGVYENTEDLRICMELLESYRSTQKELTKNTSNKQVNCNPIKTYPFAFNAYNLDQEKPFKFVKPSQEKKQQKAEETSSEMTEEEREKQKDEIVKKIFG